MKTIVLCVCFSLFLPVMSDARCRTIGESASLGSEYGTFPLYPAEQVVEAGQKRKSIAMQWLGYGIGVPDAAALPLAAAAGFPQSWREIIKPRDLHLQPGRSRSGVPAENLNDNPGPIEHRHAGGTFKVF